MSSHLGNESFASTPGSRSASRSGSSSTSSSSKGSSRSNGLYGASANLAASNSALSRPAPSHGLARSASATSNSVRQIASDLISYTKSSNPNPCKPPCKPMPYLSAFEQSLLKANIPIELNETEEITVHGQRGIWANKQEVVNWKGEIPIEDYEINEDADPEIVTKSTCQRLEYLQEIAIRYLRPPTPPPPGEILINQECNKLTPPAPPLIIRQQPCRPSTPEPLVVREAPPQPPAPICPKIITISGKRLPPPPRKVIIERLAPLPCKPQSVIIERWLPYADLKRRVIFKNNCCPDPVICKPKNVIVQWEAPCVSIRKEFKYLGVIKANPAEYVARYGNSLTLSQDLPSFVKEIATPEGLTLAADYKRKAVHELEGDLEALKLVDLDKEGLSEYKDFLASLGLLKSASLASIKSAIASLKSSGSSRSQLNSTHNETAASAVASRPSSTLARSASVSTLPKNTPLTKSSSRSSSRASQQSSPGAEFTRTTSSVHGAGSVSVTSTRHNGGSRAHSVASPLRNTSSANEQRSPSDIIEVIFKSIDRNNKGRISVSDAEKILLRLNSRLGRKYGEDDVNAFFVALDVNHDNTIDMDEFKNAFKTLNLV